AVFAALRELEFEHAAGHVSDADFADLRARYEGEAAVILGELDRLGTVEPEPPRVEAITPRGSAWRHPIALGTFAVLLVAFGVGPEHADRALETFDKALAIDPSYLPALLYQGQVLYEVKKDVGGAIRSWEKFMALAPPGEDRDRVAKMIADARAGR